MGTHKNMTNLLGIFVFFNFIGYTILLLMGINFGLMGFTRSITIPIRIFLVIICLYLITKRPNKIRTVELLFYTFSTLFTFRVLIDSSNDLHYYRPYSELFLYFLSFTFIPFISLVNLNYEKINLNRIYQYFLLSALLFCIISINFYGSFIGKVERLNSDTADIFVISPLALSYCSSLVIGIGIAFLTFNKDINYKWKLLTITCIILSFVPYFLGASRGSLIALFASLVLIFINNKATNIVKAAFVIIILAFTISLLDSYLNSGLLTRLLGTQEAIEQGNSSATRILIWDGSIKQFLDNPVFGDMLNCKYNNHHPHNLIIETLQALGILGFIPVATLLILGFKSSFTIIKHNRNFAWTTILFTQAFFQNLFSGSIFNSSWLWASLAIVIGLSRISQSTKQASIQRNYGNHFTFY